MAANAVYLYVRFADGEVHALNTTDEERTPHHGYPISLPFIWSFQTFALLFKYQRAHKSYDGDIEQWDLDFMASIVNTDILYDVYLAALTMDIEDLTNLCADRIADAVRNATVDEVKLAFNIVTGLDEAEELQAQNLHKDVLLINSTEPNLPS